MTILKRIAFLAIISLLLITFVACQQNQQATNEEKTQINKIKTQANKIEDTEKSDQEEVALGPAGENKEIESILREEEEKAKAKAKEINADAKEKSNEIETEINDVSDKFESIQNEVKNITESNTEPPEEQGPHNLFYNSDFSEGLKGWYYDNDVCVVELDGKKCIESNGPSKGQNRIWQTFNAISGHVYRLSFKVKAENIGAFAIFRDDQKYDEQYLFSDSFGGWKEFQKDFISSSDGNYSVFLTSQGKGKFYFSEASIIDASLKEK